MTNSQTPLTLETAIGWAKSGHESDKVYRFLFLYPDDLFTIPKNRSWSIAHQIVYNGNVSLLQRVLALYYDDLINIRTPTVGEKRKTLLDIATERQAKHEEMYTYVKELFIRDDLIQAARRNDWKSVEKLLEENSQLANEKPPYSTFFVLHYLVQNGDKETFEKFFRRFQFDINVVSADRETPLALAKRLKRNDLYSILEPTITDERSNASLIQDKSSVPVETTSPELPYPKVDLFPSPKFSTNSIVLTEEGDYQLQKISPFSKPNCSQPSSDSSAVSSTAHVQSTEPKHELLPNPTDESTSNSSVTPVTPSSKQQLLRNLTCPLTQQIFVDPVIAGDGQTYERQAILEWITKYECSPITGVAMDNKVTDNVELQKMIQSMQN